MMRAAVDTPLTEARDIVISGRVQGVGYRPFVYRQAMDLGLAGSVYNGAGKVYLHVEGSKRALDLLEQRLVDSAPPLAQPCLETSGVSKTTGADCFIITASRESAETEIHVPPDLFTCDDCLDELTDPRERRYGYPFINCTQCGPRYTIIGAMPYDRPNTSMRDFALCPDCATEYGSPLDRRFHAQPLACPVCGPRLTYAAGNDAATATDALERAVRDLEAGRIVAVKGVGGYHLLCDACDEATVQALRLRKQRPDKPLAVMFPLRSHDGLAVLRQYLAPGPGESAALLDPARSIVLVQRREETNLARGIAPGLTEIGAFLPYSPLHHLLLESFGGPLVATSGNISGEPVITDPDEAQQRLGNVADAFLHHDRPIVRPADDAVVRIMAGAPCPIRPGRGTAPIELELPFELERPLIATGAHMKNTVALAWGRRVVVSPHIGELDSPRSRDVFRQVIADLQALYGVEAQILCCDAHPGYAGSRWAREQGMKYFEVPHHHAHASALAGEHPDVDEWLVFAWDGVGLGTDGTLWGGETFAGAPGRWQRVASFRLFRLVGGDRAGREPWRSAAALHWELGHDWLPPIAGSELARTAWLKRAGVFETSAAGRLFDAAASLVLGRHKASYEGQGPMELEHAARGDGERIGLPLARDQAGLWRTDWAPLLPALEDESIPAAQRAATFHRSLAGNVLDQVRVLERQRPVRAVGLTGGVFQNRWLTEQVVSELTGAGYDVRLHRKVPANDGGLSFGQAAETAALQHLEACA